MSLVEINLDAAGEGYIKVDGEEMRFVTAIAVEAKANELVKVHITLIPRRVIFTSHAAVTKADELEDAIE
jgi:hypothetical protein